MLCQLHLHMNNFMRATTALGDDVEDMALWIQARFAVRNEGLLFLDTTDGPKPLFSDINPEGLKSEKKWRLIQAWMYESLHFGHQATSIRKGAHTNPIQ